MSFSEREFFAHTVMRMHSEEIIGWVKGCMKQCIGICTFHERSLIVSWDDHEGDTFNYAKNYSVYLICKENPKVKCIQIKVLA